MSDPNDRPLARAGGKPDAPDAGDAAARAEEERVAPAIGAPRPRSPVTMAMLIGVAVLAVGVAAAVWFDGKRTQRALRVEVAQRLSEIESSAQAGAKTQTQLANDLREAQAKVALLEARLAESQAQQAALDALYRDLAPSRDEIAISEIEQVLLVASQQLQLAGNVSSALTALQLADTKLQRLDRPQFVPLRRALSRDMDRLKAVPFVDVVGMSLKLDQALAAVDTLPLAMDERLPAPAPDKTAAPADVPAWRRLLRDLWDDVRQLVRIESSDRPAAPLVPAAQQYYLRENLKLRLLTARIALLARNDASFAADLTAVDTWIKQYFDTRAKPVQMLQATIKQLAATPLPGETPDLTRSLEALRVLRLGQERAAPGKGAAPVAPVR
jgi:uroporphyrin-3 C-methyltransferase